MIGFVLGAVFGTGVLLAAFGYRRVAVPTLESRVLPYVKDLASVSSPSTDKDEFLSWAREQASRLKRSLAESVSGSTGVNERLMRAGSAERLSDFRAQQWSWGVLGFVVAAATGLILWSIYQFVPVAIIALSFSGFVGGMYFADIRLSAAVKKQEARMAQEFPVIADLLALSVAAGESPLAAVERVVDAGDGPLTRELARLVAQVRSGGTTAEAFDSLAARIGVPSVARFASTMAVAIERGTPLIAVLHAQAADARELSRRSLIETAGRREILMLMPVVFLVLPVVIVFAFYPGMVALEFVSGV